MSLRADQKALLFLGAIALLGAGVRVVRAASGQGTVSGQPALERQLAASDSARLHARKRVGSAGKGRGRSTAAQGGRGRNNLSPTAGPPAQSRSHVNGKLDLDIATAAEIDSLPGISPTIAKRIVADRMVRGPFLNAGGLRRVKGIGAKLLSRIDTLVVFTGVVAQPSMSDTIIPRGKRSKRG